MPEVVNPRKLLSRMPLEGTTALAAPEIPCYSGALPLGSFRRTSPYAGVAELADALGLGPSAARLVGSNPSARTTLRTRLRVRRVRLGRAGWSRDETALASG